MIGCMFKFNIINKYEYFLALCFRHSNNGSLFSPQGIRLVVDYFKLRGHKVVVFLPQNCKGCDRNNILSKMEVEKTLIYTPSRKVKFNKVGIILCLSKKKKKKKNGSERNFYISQFPIVFLKIIKVSPSPSFSPIYPG
jgi:hypothetical protein